MAYALRHEIETAAGGSAAFLALADFDSDGAIDEDVLVEVQTATEDWIDGYVRVRYDVPLVAPTAKTREIVAEEIVYKLRQRRDTLDEGDRLDHAERITWLTGIAAGTILLVDVDPATTLNARGSYVENDRANSLAAFREVF